MICCHEFFESIRTTSKRKSTKELIATVPGLTIQGKIRGPCHLLWQSQVWGLSSSHELTREVKLGSKSSSKDHEVHYKKLVLKFCRQEEKCGFPIRKISMGFPASTSVELFGDTFKPFKSFCLISKVPIRRSIQKNSFCRGDLSSWVSHDNYFAGLMLWMRLHHL